MFIVKYRKIFFALSALFVAFSLSAIFFFGLHFSIEFTGGSLVEVDYAVARPDTAYLEGALKGNGFSEFTLQPAGEKGMIVRTRDLEGGNHTRLLSALAGNGTFPLEEKRFTSIGPTIGEELKKKAWIALVLVVLAIILFIAFAFRRVSEPVSSWKYGIVAIVALLHDVILPTGVFAFLGSFSLVYDIDTLFVTALLTILGFSVHDTIVVFDRIRENLRRNKETHRVVLFEEVVGTSLRETMTRSINTSLTVVLVMAVLYVMGSSATQEFALALLIGVVAGTYSSIFLASPLLVAIERRQKTKAL